MKLFVVTAAFVKAGDIKMHGMMVSAISADEALGVLMKWCPADRAIQAPTATDMTDEVRSWVKNHPPHPATEQTQLAIS